MVTHTLTETYDNDAHFDLTYIICVWITFLPTVTLPWFYAHWVLIGSLSRSVPNTLVREAVYKIKRRGNLEFQLLICLFVCLFPFFALGTD